MAVGKGNIAILGAGSWGSTLAWLLASNGKNVSLWTHSRLKAELIRSQNRLTHPLAVSIPKSVSVSADLADAVEDADIVIFCCRSEDMRGLSREFAQIQTAANGASGNKPILVSAAKGLEMDSLKRMSEVLSECCPGHPVCALSGPNLAVEILSKLPTASVVASSSAEILPAVQRELSVPGFRLYSNPDICGVELGGSLKNIIAIASGVSDGLGLGVNARAALITRGLSEMTRLAVKLGAQASTFSGLAGIGDLVATCSGPLSRNYRLGFQIAHGKSLTQAVAELGAVAEGVTTTYAVCELSKKVGVDLPIACQVEATLKGRCTPADAMMSLMSRPLSSEQSSDG